MTLSRPPQIRLKTLYSAFSSLKKKKEKERKIEKEKSLLKILQMIQPSSLLESSCVRGEAETFKYETSLASYLKCRGQIRSDQWSTLKHNLKPAQQLQVGLTEKKKKKKKKKSGLTRSGLQRAPFDK